MYKVIVALAAAAGSANAIFAPFSNALQGRSISSLETRQSAGLDNLLDSVPAACQSTCSSAVTILQACANADLSGCLQICEQDRFDGLIDCANCGFKENGQTPSAAEQRYLSSSLDQLVQVCAQQGKTVTPKALSGSVSGSSPATASAIGAPRSSATFASSRTSAPSAQSSAPSTQAPSPTASAGGGAVLPSGAASPLEIPAKVGALFAAGVAAVLAF